MGATSAASKTTPHTSVVVVIVVVIVVGSAWKSKKPITTTITLTITRHDKRSKVANSIFHASMGTPAAHERLFRIV
jgi:hypothetical protein